MSARYTSLFIAVWLVGCGLGDNKSGGDSAVACTTGPDLCDLKDNDCDGQVDEDQPATVVWPDLDSDGYGDASDSGTAICGTLLGYVDNNQDCNDDDSDMHPGAWDGCDLEDNDCDGLTDEDDPPYVLWPDADGDGQGNAEADAIETCVWSSANVTNNLDCDDTDLNVYEGATEVCDGKDNNCDGVIDEDDVCSDELTGAQLPH